MYACDHHNDSPAARAAMRRDVLDTPRELREQLLRHFSHAYPPDPPIE